MEIESNKQSNFENTKISSTKDEIEDQKCEDGNLKEKILKYHQEHCTSKRINVSKIVKEYQMKFDAPKCMIIKWLGLTTQKSLFRRSGYGSKIDIDSVSDESGDSKDSENKSSPERPRDFFNLDKSKEASDKEIQPLSHKIECNVTQKYSSGKISEIDTSSCNKSDDQKVGLRKLQIRIKKSKFRERFQLSKCKSPVVSADSLCLSDDNNQKRESGIQNSKMICAKSPKNICTTPHDLKVNGRMLKLMHLNQIRSPNHSFKLSKNCNNTDIFKTKWMDKLNMSEIKTGRRLFSQGKEQDLSSLNDGCKDRSQFPKLKVSLPVKSRGRMPFGLNHPTIRVKCEMPLSSLSQASKRNLPLIHSPVTSTKTLVEV